ncbi:Sec-independent protein translocase protein TatA [Rickettsiales endosymbiont of Paramecium tredecaurelia]|uniref:Sec-independent protein translocase subunit TatA n=1 Tax=Candidatus Sarmatiella mevalonica TaxID=2770581 RepID=UPI0019220C97|nr:Sec-independent protein translocase subunit TatA [Candidatus Sarmatiella mevalonica]MBL3284426.1 Sec-independent protein translocase protein TatA [Candidatus Sarmatiella mevalonica]
MGMSITHLLVIVLVVFILFGAGKLPSVMQELGKGVRAFKKAMDDKEENKE